MDFVRLDSVWLGLFRFGGDRFDLNELALAWVCSVEFGWVFELNCFV
jgi:hypothetical protein